MWHATFYDHFQKMNRKGKIAGLKKIAVLTELD
jgi:hypothetical protein